MTMSKRTWNHIATGFMIGTIFGVTIATLFYFVLSMSDVGH